MQFSSDQLDSFSDKLLIQKINKELQTKLPLFNNLTYPQRLEYINACIEIAHSLGFNTERGIASYALCAWLLSAGFERRSLVLTDILKSNISEDQKAYAMNEWVRASLKLPEHPEVADGVLMRLFDQKTTKTV